jgi:hypothetical protein
MNLTVNNITLKLRSIPMLSVQQVICLDWLNAVASTGEIVALVAGESPIDASLIEGGADPEPGWETVAQRILARRDSLPRFTSLGELADIEDFELPQFEKLIVRFMRLRVPFPTGKGVDFDNMLAAIGALELDAYHQQSSAFAEMLRQVVWPNENPGLNGKDFPWRNYFRDSEKISVPVEWAVTGHLANAVGHLRGQRTIAIGGIVVDLGHVLIGLNALNGAQPENWEKNLKEFDIPIKASTYLKLLSEILYFTSANTQSEAVASENPIAARATELRIADAYGIADAFNLGSSQERSISSKLYSYYVKPQSPIQQRLSSLVMRMELGTLQGGQFSDYVQETLRNAIVEIAAQSGYFGVQNGFGIGPSAPTEVSESTLLQAADLADRFVQMLGQLSEVQTNRPAIVSWNRLEGRPRTLEVSRPWSAEVRDPLWFLSRQWQLGEFIGQDTGSAIKMRVNMERSSVDRYSLRDQPAVAYDAQVPMETVAERGLATPDLSLSQEMGLHWDRILRQQLLLGSNPQPAAIGAVSDDFAANPAFHFVMPASNVQPEFWSNPELVNYLAALTHGRALNGWLLYLALKAYDASELLTGGYGPQVMSEVDAAGQEFKAWFERRYAQPPTSSGSAWNPTQLAYQFACSAPNAPDALQSSTVLVADDFASGQLDWYSFDVEMDELKHPTLRPSVPDQALVKRDQLSLIPTDLRFPGMPLPRWWQMEDGQLNFEHMVLQTSDAATLPFMEFIASYSNDWLLVPYKLPTGSLCEVKDVVVRDVFGQRTRVLPAGAGDASDWRRWSMFTLHRRNLGPNIADNRVFFPTVVVKSMEGKPIEEVRFVRDEMANMVWGIEEQIADGMGGAMEGFEAATRLSNYMEAQAAPVPPTPLVPNEAKIRYKLGTSVPENWIPFMPVRLGGQVGDRMQLQRAAMPRVIAGEPTARIRPRTDLLRANYDGTVWHPYYVHEEEVPRSGATVRQNWQRTRWFDGTIVTWLGRRKLSRRGEANSGLRFDLIEEKKD